MENKREKMAGMGAGSGESLAFNRVVVGDVCGTYPLLRNLWWAWREKREERGKRRDRERDEKRQGMVLRDDIIVYDRLLLTSVAKPWGGGSIEGMKREGEKR